MCSSDLPRPELNADMEPQALGLTHFWAQADAINRAVGLLLLAMSVVSWTVMLGKLRTALALRGGAQSKLQQFWAAPALADGVAQLRALDPTGVFSNLAQAAADCNQAQTGMAGRGDRADRLLRELRTALRASTARLDAGQTWLASIGATAPFRSEEHTSELPVTDVSRMPSSA